MAESYKGLTVQFGADYSSLSGALQTIGKESSSAARELKQVQSALKMDPGNTTLLTKQQEAYAKQVSATKQKLDVYKDAYSQLEAKQQSGQTLTEKEKAQYEQLSTSIATTEARLKSYTKNLEDSTAKAKASQSELGKLGTKIEETGEKYKSSGEKIKTAGTAITTASAVAGAAALTAWDQVDSAQDSAIAKTGATGQAAEDLGKSVTNVAETAPGDWETIGDAVGEVSSRFDLTGTDLENLSTVFLEFADTTGTDVTTAISDVSRTMSDFGISSDQTESVLGLLQSTSQNTGVDVATLSSSLDKCGGSMSASGVSLQETTTLLGQFQSAGMDADTATTGLMKAATNCAESGQDMGTTMQDLATRLKDPATSAEATQDAIDLFGSKSGLSFANLLQSGSVDLSSLGGSLDDFGTVVNDTFEATQDGPDKLKLAIKNLQTSLSEVGAQLAPVIGAIADKISQLSTAFQNLPESSKQAISNLILLGATIGPILIVVGTIITKLQPLGASLSSLATKIAALQVSGSSIGTMLTSLSAGPIVAIIAAIAAVVASVIYLWNTNESFRNNLVAAWDTIVSALAPAQAAFSRVGDSIGQVLTVAQPVFDVLANIIGGVFVAAVDSAASVVSAAIGVISGAFEMVSGVIETVVGVVVGLFTGDWSTALDGAATVAQGFVDAVSSIFNGLSGIVQGVVDGVVGMFTHCFDNIHIPTFHIEGSFNLDPTNFQVPSIQFYGAGGVTDQATLGVFGEAGTEITAPLSQAPQLIADTMEKAGMGFGGMSVKDMASAVSSGVSDALKSGSVAIMVDGKELTNSIAGHMDVKLARMQTLGGANV